MRVVTYAHVILDRLELLNCRNIAKAELELSHSFNLIVGANGAGKTTLLEAVHLLIRGKSFRRGGVDSIISHDTARMDLAARWRTANQTSISRCCKVRTEPIRLERDGRPLDSISQAALLNPLHALLPSLAELVFGPPVVRRQWLDWGVFHVKPQFANELRRYRHALSQRNAALRTKDQTTIRLWSEKLAIAGEQVARPRREYMKSLVPHLGGSLKQMAEEISVDVDIFDGFRSDSLQEELEKQVRRDVELGTTRYGPHRADIIIRIRRDGSTERVPNRAVVSLELSRGQGKAVACAMILAQAHHLKQHRAVPIFLIDDIGSELDAVHIERLLFALQDLNAQVLATTISADEFMKPRTMDGFADVKVATMVNGGLHKPLKTK